MIDDTSNKATEEITLAQWSLFRRRLGWLAVHQVMAALGINDRIVRIDVDHGDVSYDVDNNGWTKYVLPYGRVEVYLEDWDSDEPKAHVMCERLEDLLEDRRAAEIDLFSLGIRPGAHYEVDHKVSLAETSDEWQAMKTTPMRKYKRDFALPARKPRVIGSMGVSK